MNSLRSLQEEFRRAVFSRGSDDPFAMQIIPGPVTPESRIAIYRNNAFTNLRNAMQSAYPVIRQLVGVDFFDYATTEYIYGNPSSSGDLHEYGEGFATFLAGFPAVEALVYLADVARLEWACHRAYFAGDAHSLNHKRLAAIPDALYGELRFRFHPASHLLHSPYPIDKIWRVNQAGYNGDQHIELTESDVWLLIHRPRHNVEVITLTSGEWHLLDSLAQGSTLNCAYVAALESDPMIDLGEALQRFVLEAILVDVVTPDQGIQRG